VEDLIKYSDSTGKDVVWELSYELTTSNLKHVLGILKKYEQKGHGIWFQRGGYIPFVEELPIIKSESEFSRGDSNMVVARWKVYPNKFLFGPKQYIIPHAKPKDEPSTPILPEYRHALPAPILPEYTHAPSAPKGELSYVEWKTHEYKAQVTSEGSYIMHHVTGNKAYNVQAGAWKKIKNIAQEQTMSELDFKAVKSKLYEPPFNLCIDDVVHSCAKYKVLRNWGIKDGTDIERSNIMKNYPIFVSLDEFIIYNKNNTGVMQYMLADLNNVVCEIQQRDGEKKLGRI